MEGKNVDFLNLGGLRFSRLTHIFNHYVIVLILSECTVVDFTVHLLCHIIITYSYLVLHTKLIYIKFYLTYYFLPSYHIYSFIFLLHWWSEYCSFSEEKYLKLMLNFIVNSSSHFTVHFYSMLYKWLKYFFLKISIQVYIFISFCFKT